MDDRVSELKRKSSSGDGENEKHRDEARQAAQHTVPDSKKMHDRAERVRKLKQS